MRWFFLLLLMPSVSASLIDIDVDIAKSDIVTERISIHLDQRYEGIEYTTRYLPVTVIYDGEYIIRQEEQYYILSFDRGDNISFTLIFDNLIDKGREQKVFRSSFSPQDADEIRLKVSLPEHFSLAEREPSSIPKPEILTTDGKKISLHYTLKEDSDISIFYTGERKTYWWIGGILLFAAFATTAAFLVMRKKSEQRIRETLSSEEQKVMAQISNKGTKQKDIAKALDFSKSKMSKVIRKLEEKGLIRKEPYFKTNKLWKR